jgi:hypothetical protein
MFLSGGQIGIRGVGGFIQAEFEPLPGVCEGGRAA